MIRKATQQDILELIELSIEALNIEPYPEMVISREKVAANVKECVCSAMNFAWVSEDERGITGGFGAIVVPSMVYERNQAIVLMWYSKTHGDGIRLIRQFMEWLKTRIMVKQVFYGGDHNMDPRMGHYLQRLGFQMLPSYVLTR